MENILGKVRGYWAKCTLCLCGLLVVGQLAFGQRVQEAAIVLSDSARISLITASAGAELYTIFGHSALRVRDVPNGVDQCYNYGTFDFDQPNFYLNFLRGKLLYSLNIEPYRLFERAYWREHRNLTEQVLRLNAPQRQLLFDLLQTNALPENRNYKYDFFYDNCATRIRDIVEQALAQPNLVPVQRLEPSRSMRDLLRPSLVSMPWTQFGIDLILGYPTDAAATTRTATFLPDYLQQAFAKATLTDGMPLVDGAARPIIEMHTFPQAAFDAFWQKPVWVMSLVALLGLLGMFYRPWGRIFDPIFWLSIGAIGFIIFALWFLTDHGATKLNFNLLWAWPTHLFTFWRMQRLPRYRRLAGIAAALAVAGWFFWPQAFPVAALPIAALAAVKGLLKG